MRRPLVAGNWKMNGSKESIKALLDGIKAGMGDVKEAEVAVCVPAIYIAEVESQLTGSPIMWGAQNLSNEASGAFTGEISAAMINDFNCAYVAVGHSERRTLFGEDDAMVAKKFAAARASGLKPIFCIGETLEEREQGITNDVVARQIDAVVELEGIEALADSVVAYEPVWAIGTGKTASPEQAQEVHAFIRQRIAEKSADVAEKVQILYGGSMNAGNAAELLSMADIDGGLIGGASLKAEDFLTICRAAG
ncbi:triose-phosphate isomerase [Solemya pervernicosa gill symbiont]|uniref:Triosephosphate isomerase n=2 Tax=Gammaproteobacteria incertae sedis TaxID=118884 RepID=A0A1T2L9G2_9GAMM|nr:triose-phosphate isomerase [Candidatus Reidiella endopervernicosa]OOZ41737.1 triose-phosphate isomerase [Solemya pervernicosa gill symbiont]QKQ26478.1 triose-phosphate isomerase [Candidatus Reidiella endopervernicosa]